MKGGLMRGPIVLVIAVALMAAWSSPCARAEDKKADDAAVVRARKQVQMLDDLYKTAIVLITENYVDEASDLAAGAAFQKLFEVMRQKGYHDVRLLDATGQPYNEKNLPRDAFEKAAIAALKSGQPNYEGIVSKDGERYLKVATPIPVVMKKCTLCHPAYEKPLPVKPLVHSATQSKSNSANILPATRIAAVRSEGVSGARPEELTLRGLRHLRPQVESPLASFGIVFVLVRIGAVR